MDFLDKILDGSGLSEILPDLTGLADKLDLVLRALVMVGPLALLGFGLFYFLAPPKEANYEVGYRFRYGMSRVAVWQFMQRLAGMVYGGLGLVLMIVMTAMCAKFARMNEPDMVWFGFKCVIVELELILVATLAIDITIVAMFDRKGVSRRQKRLGLVPEEEEAQEEKHNDEEGQ